MKAFIEINRNARYDTIKRIKQVVGVKINKMYQVLNNKIFNHKATAILSIH